MTDSEGRPVRRYEVGIRIGADSWEDVCAAVRHLLFIYESEGEGHNLTSGGPTYGMIAIDEKNDSVTHDSYFAELDKWLEEHRDNEPHA